MKVTLNMCTKKRSKWEVVYYLLATAEDAQFAETDVEGRREKRSILLLDDDDIDGTRQCGRIDAVVVFFEVADKLANVLHVFTSRTVTNSKESKSVNK